MNPSTEKPLAACPLAVCPLAALLALIVTPAITAQNPVPSTLPFQGRLSQQNGSLVTAKTAMEFRIYSIATGGTALWKEGHAAVPVEKGLFKIELGTVSGFPPKLFSGKDLFLGVRVGIDPESKGFENHGYQPAARGVPFGSQYPKALRDILVENGTLNPDYTPNEATARRLGWALRDRDRDPDESR